MKIAAILPFVLYAALATAKRGKKPKFGSSGNNHNSNSNNDDEDQQQQSADETTDSGGFFGVATTTAVPTSTGAYDVGAVISSFYAIPGAPTIAPAASTALASGLLSVESSWFASPAYTSADAAISAALPLSLSASVAVSGYRYGEIMTQDWFTQSVPASLQTAVTKYVSAIESVHYRYATVTATGDGGSAATKVAGSGAMKTSAPLKVAAAVGVVGGIFAAFL